MPRASPFLYICIFKQTIYNKVGMENLKFGKTMDNRKNTDK